MVQTQIWPGWDTVRVIGSGSCGTVYEIRKADDPTGSYRAALKVISVPATQEALQPYLEKGLSQAEMQAAFRKQAEAAIRALEPFDKLNGCPNIVCYEECMLVPQQDGIGWSILLRMPLMLPVADYFAKHGLNVKHVQRLGTELCTALERSAAYGLSHGNIKPGNILLDTGGEFMLTDFGMAPMMKELGITPNADSYSFMAPEVFRGACIGERSDVYSLGFVLYWLLNDCRVPFLPDGMDPKDPRALAQAHHTRFSTDRLPAPAHGRQTLRSAVLKACELDVSSRYPSAGALRAALSGHSEAPAVQVPIQTPRQMPKAPQAPVPPPMPEYQAPVQAAYVAAPAYPEPQPIYPNDMDTAAYAAPVYEAPKKKRPVGLIVLLALLLALIIGCGAFLTVYILDNMESASDSDTEEEKEDKTKQNEIETSTEEGGSTAEDEGGSTEDDETSEEDDDDDTSDDETETTAEAPYPADAVSFNGHHYYMYNCSHAGDWEAAKKFCEEQGGHLAVISSRDEDTFLYNYMAGSGFENAYFGYHDSDREGSWNWVGGEHSSYTNWYPGEPNNYASREHYAMYYLGYHDGTWNDDNGLIFDLDNAPLVLANSITSSSQLTEGATVYNAVKAIDGNTTTPWSEGASGQGIGETLTMNLTQTYNIVGLTIHGGFQYSPDYYTANSRPRVIKLTFSNGVTEELELADYYGAQTLYLSHPVSASSVTIEIVSVYPGDQFEDTCISELMFIGGVLNTGFICEWDE